MQGTVRRTGGWKVGTVIFLVLALVLAVFSGDVLLVLAVACAIGGLMLLTGRRSHATVGRPAAVPLQSQAAPVAAAPIRPQARRGSRRMAIRRYRSAAMASKRVASRSLEGTGAAHSSVADAPSQAQVIQVLQ